MPDGSNTVFEPAATLKSRTYLGLILAQFLAAFNDQAIHIVAIFYATDLLQRYVALQIHGWNIDEKAVISLVTACFISPFFFFSTFAGMLADRFSKRSILVFWKIAEVGMMALAVVGFLMPHLADTGIAAPETLATWSAALVVLVVFLMGTHSAFFVPAKYGVMPEILHPIVLSRGNGFLEGTSFVAQIIGTTCGGILYGRLKSTVVVQPSGNELIPGQEWIIGVILLGLAIIGAIASLVIARMPPAAPDRPLTWKLWQPLRNNVGVLLRSRPLALAVLGIAFFSFITLFARQTLLYYGETDKQLQEARREAPRDPEDPDINPDPNRAHHQDDDTPGADAATGALRAEFRVAFLIALIGLGIGIGSPLAGALSGNKVELGLVPIGATFLIVCTALMALLIERKWPTRICLVAIGIAAGFYIVPLYTLLQHRAPKDSKGNLVATSNFINVAGGLLAVAVFYAVTFGLEKVLGLNTERQDVSRDPGLWPQYTHELELQMQLPKVLFLILSLMTVAMLILLCRKLPDFFVRALLWLRAQGRYRLKVIGLHHVPTEGPVILATNCDRFETCMQVVTAVDRFTRFVFFESEHDEKPPWLLRYLARRTGLVALGPGKIAHAALAKGIDKAHRTLAQGNLVGVTADSEVLAPEMIQVLAELRALGPAVILPVYCATMNADETRRHRRVQMVIGHPLRSDATHGDIVRTIRLLGKWMHELEAVGTPAATSLIPGASVPASLPASLTTTQSGTAHL